MWEDDLRIDVYIVIPFSGHGSHKVFTDMREFIGLFYMRNLIYFIVV
jgi:hypothetical protein